jgi:hypothetical protein
VNYNYLHDNQVTDIEIVSSEQVDIDEAEIDEMWSFVHDKSQQYWLWWAIDHITQVYRLRIVLVQGSIKTLTNYRNSLLHLILKLSIQMTIMPIKTELKEVL